MSRDRSTTAATSKKRTGGGCRRRLFPRWLRLAPLLFAPALLTAACTYRGDIDAAPTIKVTWFSYLNGDDIREACVPGAPFRYRLVYNADYARQVRSYAMMSDGEEGAYFVARAITGSGIVLDGFTFKDPLGLGGFQRAGEQIDGAALAEIDRALEWSGAFETAPKGLRLYSDQYYWVAALCHEGRFYFNAWLYPSDRYDRISFPQTLYVHDKTGIAIAPPRKVGPAARLKGAPQGTIPNQIFQIRVGDNGLTGLAGI